MPLPSPLCRTGLLALALLSTRAAPAAWVSVVNHSRQDWRLAADPGPGGDPRTGTLALARERTLPPGNLAMFQAQPSGGRLDQAFRLTDGGGRTLTFRVACDEAHPEPVVTLAAPARGLGTAAERVRVTGTDLEIRPDPRP